MLKEAIRKTTNGKDLSRQEMEGAMDEIMTGAATPAQIGCLLTALKMKGETVAEITGAATVMRRKAAPVPVEKNGVPLIDTCGTGGDGAGSFNISTTIAFILAGAGLRVAKHGNRSVSSSVAAPTFSGNLARTWIRPQRPWGNALTLPASVFSSLRCSTGL